MFLTAGPSLQAPILYFFFFLFFKSYVVSLYMYEYFACMSMYHLHAWCLYCAEKIIESPGSGLQKVVNVHAGTGSCHFSSS